MAAVPALPAVTGGVYTTSQISALIAAVDFFQRKPAAELRQTVAQSISDSAWTSLTFTTEDLDLDPLGTGGHSTSVNTSRWTAVYPGWILLGGGSNPVIAGVGIRGTRWAINGTAVNASNIVLSATAATGAGYPARAKRVYVNVGDYVELQVYQNSGGALNTDVTGDSASSMTLGWDRLA